MSDLQSRFEKYESNPKEAVKKEQELKNYIKVKSGAANARNEARK